jgi:ATP-dependent RNA helicase DDX24/MAK5
MLNKE